MATLLSVRLNKTFSYVNLISFALLLAYTAEMCALFALSQAPQKLLSVRNTVNRTLLCRPKSKLRATDAVAISVLHQDFTVIDKMHSHHVGSWVSRNGYPSNSHDALIICKEATP